MVRGAKPLKRFSSSVKTVNTWLKPGANEINRLYLIRCSNSLILRYAGIDVVRPGGDPAGQVDQLAGEA
jgi:hypothetical protein